MTNRTILIFRCILLSEVFIKQLSKILPLWSTIILICGLVATSCTGYPHKGISRGAEDNSIENRKVETVGASLKRKEPDPSYTLEKLEAFQTILTEYQMEEPDYGLALYRFPEFRSKVVSFYTGETGSELIASLILQAAEANDIPLGLAFSLAWVESRYNPMAVNHNTSSVDRGLFQLNSRSFPGLTEADFFNPETNAGLGMNYLRQCLNSGETEIVALAMYNAGRARVSGRGAPLMTLEYVSKILAYQEELEARFSEYCVGFRGHKIVFKSTRDGVPVDRNKGIK